MKVESTSWQEGREIPERYAFGVPDGNGKAKPEGGNVSPHVRWSDVPDGTRSFVVTVVDHDVPAEMERMNTEDDTIEESAPRQPLAHWLVADVPADVHEIPEGSSSDGIEPGGKPVGPTRFGGVTGANGYTQFFEGDEEMEGTYGGYDGPFPPWNDEKPHGYHLRVRALDVESLGLEREFGLEELERAVDGHVLADAEVVAVYSLNGA